MAKSISRDSPLAEITLRRYEKPYEMPRRALIRKICLSIGLLQPGDSRDVIVDVLQVLLDSGKEMDSENITKNVIEYRKNAKVPIKGVAPSNVRRQLKRLRDLFLIEKINNMYRITESENLAVIFEERIERYLIPSIIERVKDYFKALK